MGIRVVARIRPQQKHELDKDVIVSVASDDTTAHPTVVKVPNPKNETEDFSFQFSSVYDGDSSQQEIFDNEVAPTIKHLFNGFDVTIFAYGSTGTGKTHTMRGGKALQGRGVIPRLLSGIYRRSRKLDKDSAGQTKVEIGLSYYEIYNDKVFDLFEAPEKRTMAGLPIRDNAGKTVVVGLTERPCESLKEFEKLYDQANINRSTSATKLNASSSRSHAILCIRIAITTGEETRVSTASAIDLAGSEDNRRTDNGKERLVESSSINKSLFVLAKCVEAISQQQARVPYRESKMTRILSLGQTNGMTVMILNLAPVRSFHLDTLSSLNFANRTKKIEVREIENEPIFKDCHRAVPTLTGTSIKRQPLRPLATAVHNAAIHTSNLMSKRDDIKPAKAFSVYSDRARQSNDAARPIRIEPPHRSSPLKRPSGSFSSHASRPPKRRSPDRMIFRPEPAMSKEALENMIERKVTDILATRALDQPSIAPVPEISEEVQKRLELLEQRIEGKDDGKEQGLTFLLMAKQHAVRGEDSSALRMYALAREYFPDNAKLDCKIKRLREKLKAKKDLGVQKMQLEDGRQANADVSRPRPVEKDHSQRTSQRLKSAAAADDDDDYDAPQSISDADDYESSDGFRYSKPKKATKSKFAVRVSPESLVEESTRTPRTKRLLDIVNTRDVAQIRLLKGVGAKKAEAILEALCADEDDGGCDRDIKSLGQLGRLKGVGVRTVENMRAGLEVGI